MHGVKGASGRCGSCANLFAGRRWAPPRQWAGFVSGGGIGQHTHAQSHHPQSESSTCH